MLRTDITPAVHPQFLDLLKQKKEIANGGANVLVVNEDRGTISEISTQGKEINGQFFPFGIKLKTPLVDDWIWYRERTVKKTSVYIDVDGNLKRATLKDLRLGDEIIIQEVMDVSYPPTDVQHLADHVIKVLNRPDKKS